MPRELGDVLEAIVSGVVVVDAGGRIEELNSVACRLFERSRETAVGESLEALAGPGHALVRLAAKVIDSGVGVSAYAQAIERRNEENAEVDISASPLFGELGTLDGVVLVLRDRFAQRRLEQLEAERGRFESFGRIAAGLAHEIKNPLAGIRGAGELLSQRASETRTRETADLVVKEATRIAALVDDFMVFARGEQLRLAPVNIHQVLDGVLDLLAHDPVSSGIGVVRVYDPSIPELLADADRLTQVFLNLARNAMQAMQGAGAKLTVSTRMTLEHRIALEDGRALATLAVWLEDSGRGMDEAELREARTPFFTTRAGGTGLGLSVAEYWVAQHRGLLHLESEKGAGTRARVTLPLRRFA